jgi:hypothetical protein
MFVHRIALDIVECRYRGGVRDEDLIDEVIDNRVGQFVRLVAEEDLAPCIEDEKLINHLVSFTALKPWLKHSMTTLSFIY